MKKTRLSVGEKIKQLRIDNSMTQEDLAKEFMVTRQTISSWERNQSIPDIQMLRMISKYFGVTNDYLLLDSYSRVKEMLLRYNVLFIVAATAFFTLVGLVIYNHYHRVYDYRFEPYKGVCAEYETESSLREKYDGYILALDEEVNIELDGNKYCIPLKFVFESQTRTERSNFNIQKITPPQGVEITDFESTFKRVSENVFLFEFKVNFAVISEDDRVLENIVEGEKVIELDIP